jgi:hypothetical protein
MLKTVSLRKGSTTVIVAVTNHKYRSQFIDDDDETVNLYSVIVIKGNIAVSVPLPS